MALMDSKDAEKLKRQAEFKKLVEKLPCPAAKQQTFVKEIRGTNVINRLWIRVTPNNNDPSLRNEAGYIDVFINGQDMGRTWWDTHGNGAMNYKTIEKAWDALQKRLIGLAYYIQ